MFIGRTDDVAEMPILWPPDVKNWLIWKDSDAGKDWRWKEKRMTENEMVEWHHWLNGHEFGQTLGVGDGRGGLSCCSPWGRKESDMTEWLQWTELMQCLYVMNPIIVQYTLFLKSYFVEWYILEKLGGKIKIHLFSLLHLSTYHYLLSMFLLLDLSYHLCQ